MKGIFIRLGTNSYGADTHFSAGTDDTNRYFPSIGY
jgi:hypothetical protein